MRVLLPPRLRGFGKVQDGIELCATQFECLCCASPFADSRSAHADISANTRWLSGGLAKSSFTIGSFMYHKGSQETLLNAPRVAPSKGGLKFLYVSYLVIGAC